tara:strand:+ start:112 stop:549 length:438 start_codon:yes stop_codon:yes gene_type:complete
VKKIFAILLLLSLGLTWFFWGSASPPSDPIREPIRKAAHAAREANLKGFMRHISEDYDDGTYRYDTLKAFLFRRFHSKGGVNVSLGPISIDEQAGTNIATVRFVADFHDGFPGKRGGSVEQRSFTVEMRRFEGRWVVQSQSNELP